MENVNQIRFSDRTLLLSDQHHTLSFRDKLELCRLIDKLGVAVIEMNPISHKKADILFIKTVASVVTDAVIAVPVSFDSESLQDAWEALKTASSPRLQVSVPVSSVQMEYLFHLKPEKMSEFVVSTIRACRLHTQDVEFVAEDATRADPSFLKKIIDAAISAGANTITLCDTAGVLMPGETADFINQLKNSIPALSDVSIGYSCSARLNLADACAIAAAFSGVSEIKTTACEADSVFVSNLACIIHEKGMAHGVSCTVRMEQIRKLTSQATIICRHENQQSFTAVSNSSVSEAEDNLSLDAHDTMETVFSAAEKLGYELNPEDRDKVWQCFCRIAEKKNKITLRELEAIIAAEAMQVDPVYHDVQYVINTGNQFGAMSHMKLQHHDNELEGVSAGDGAIDAAFKSIEQATGRHFELDEFQIQAVSEGREAMAETIVKLRSDGKLYSGRGISTDIVGAGIMAYINALNKIVWEEEA